MATFTSSWRTYGSGAQWRLILIITDPPSVGTGTSSVSLTATLQVQTTGSLSDTVNSNSLSGTLGSSSGSASVSHGSSGGTTTVRTITGIINTVYGTPVPVSVTGSISGYEVLSDVSVTGSVTVPARPYQVPSAPTSVSVSRNSDTSHTVTWTRNVSTAAPYQSQQVQRSTDGGAWATVATVAGTATSWTDTTTRPDRSYAYRVRAINSSGSATSLASATVYTTPAAPGTPTATRSGPSIVLTFTNTARHDEGIKIYHSEDGGAFSLLATVAGADRTTWTHSSPDPAATHAYRVATYVGALESAQSAASNTVTLVAPPNAPTGLTSPLGADATEPLTLTWQHNPVDMSAQTRYQIRYRKGSGEWTEGPVVASAVSSATITPSDDWGADNADEEYFGDWWYWQVRTWGARDDPSPWSPTSGGTIFFSRPTATVATPADGSTVSTPTVTVEWAYYQAGDYPQQEWQVELLDDQGQVVETRSGPTDAASVTLDTVLPDGSSWTLRVRARGYAALWSEWDEVTFDVAYALPPTPTVQATWQPDTATMAIDVTVPEPVYPEVAADHINVYRSINDGPWTLIATGVPLGTMVTDYAPTVAGSNRYYAEAVSALPSVAASEVVEVATPQPGDPPGSVWISGGPGYSQACRLVSNVRTSSRPARARARHRYAGRDYPVTHVGDALSHILTLTGDHIPAAGHGDSTAAEWEALALLPGPFLWRDPEGRYLPVDIDVQVDREISGVAYRIQVTAEVVDA